MVSGVASTAQPSSQARACRSCAHFKTKCIPHPDSNIAKCERYFPPQLQMPKFNFRQFLISVRCHRLDKSCEAQIPVPRKARKRKPTYESCLLLSVYERLTKEKTHGAARRKTRWHRQPSHKRSACRCASGSHCWISDT
jgi:hypothetical protein